MASNRQQDGYLVSERDLGRIARVLNRFEPIPRFSTGELGARTEGDGEAWDVLLAITGAADDGVHYPARWYLYFAADDSYELQEGDVWAVATNGTTLEADAFYRGFSGDLFEGVQVFSIDDAFAGGGGSTIDVKYTDGTGDQPSRSSLQFDHEYFVVYITALPAGAVGVTIRSGFIDLVLPTQALQSGKVLGTNGTTCSWVAGGGGSLPDPVTVAHGGTGQTTASAGLNALLPSQGGNSGKFLQTNATDASWANAVTGSSGGSLTVSGGNAEINLAHANFFTAELDILDGGSSAGTQFFSGNMRVFNTGGSNILSIFNDGTFASTNVNGGGSPSDPSTIVGWESKQDMFGNAYYAPLYQ